MIFLILYLPSKYLFFTFNHFHNFKDITIINSIFDITFFSIFILLHYRFNNLTKIFLLLLENLFWFSFIYKETNSFINTFVIVLFISIYRTIFLWFTTPNSILLVLFKEITCFIAVIICNTIFNMDKLDFLSCMFSIISFYLEEIKFKTYLLSLMINVGISFFCFFLKFIFAQKKIKFTGKQTF